MTERFRTSSAYPPSMLRLVEEFARLPGIGRRSAERLAFWILKASAEDAGALADAIHAVKRSVRHCATCWNLADSSPCHLCADPRRDAATILVVEQPKDVSSLEQTAMFRGVFHVLMGRIDPLGGVGPESLTIDHLLERVADPTKNAQGIRIEEVILGLNPDMEGDSTALVIAERLKNSGIKVTRLARGIPSGSQIEFANRAVLADAIALRQTL